MTRSAVRVAAISTALPFTLIVVSSALLLGLTSMQTDLAILRDALLLGTAGSMGRSPRCTCRASWMSIEAVGALPPPAAGGLRPGLTALVCAQTNAYRQRRDRRAGYA